MKTQFAQRINAARTAISPTITQRDVAKRLELSPSAINLWESGKTEPSLKNLAELCEWYGVSADWLLGIQNKAPLQRRPAADVPLHTVPVVSPSELVRWHWETVKEVLQTSVEYHAQTAAAILVTSDSLTSVCPAGCYAVVSRAHRAEHGCIVLASLGKSPDPVLRRYIKEGSEELLIADDTRYPSYRLDDGVTILGRITEITQRKSIT